MKNEHPTPPASPGHRRPGARSTASAGLIVFALLARGGVLLLMPEALSADPDGYRALAENVVRHGSLGHADTPTAYRPPLYPLLLTLAVPFGNSSPAAIGVLHLALGLATVWLVYRLGRRWGLGDYSLLAAGLVACDPILLAQSAVVMTETLAGFLAVLSLISLTSAAERPSALRAGAAGGCLALAVLCRPTFLVFAAVAALALPLFGGSQPARLRGFAAFATAAAVVLAPWVVRNQVQFGRPILTTTHGGYTLLRANNPWFYGYLCSGTWGGVWNSDELDADWSKRIRRADPADEVRNDRLAYALAWRNIRRQPGMFCYACLVRVGRLWAPVPHAVDTRAAPAGRPARYAVGLWYAVEFLLAAVGLWAGWRVAAASGGNRSAAGWSGTWLWGLLLALSFTAVHTLYWTNLRMRAPLMPVVALAAAAGAAAVLRTLIGSPRPSPRN